MSLLISAAALDARSDVARGPLQPLATSLAAELTPLLDRDLYFPRDKALLSREGGRCSLDGTLLDFDPFQPHAHRCPRCGTIYRGELHDRFWIYWYQLWLAERAVHAAVLSTLGLGDQFATLAAAILDGYAQRYTSYPNSDNVLGPTRLFFSTYLESIWLLQLCVAVDLLDKRDPALGGRVREKIIEPSRRIIAGYDEGGSNRQVWNDAALLAAARLLDDERGTERAVFGASGITAHLSNGLLADGTWFEGENYHLFAHRGLWYGVTMAERAGLNLPRELTDRFQRGFATPFVTALPDFTLPSRRDSQYAISLRQWRIAEHCELGLARRDEPELIGALKRLYDDDVPTRDTGRRTSSADVERNAQASALTRADLSWRALLCARPTLPRLELVAPKSSLLEAQGIAVFRRNAGAGYVAVDYGHSGGGHGHPDRLNLLLADGDRRWLDDAGTGSYVDPSLHWYRSTLAHNAPLIDGQSQRSVSGALVAYDERGAAGWIVATANGVAPDVSLRRTVVVLSNYLIDEIEWRSENEHSLDLPLQADFTLDDVEPLEAAALAGGGGLEDGFRFARDPMRQRVSRDALVHGVAHAPDGASLHLWARSDRAVEWWRAVAPGPPGQGDRAFRFARMFGSSGRLRTVLAWTNEIATAEDGDELRISLRDGTTHLHRRTPDGWHIELIAGQARSSIDLGGLVGVAPPIISQSARAPESIGRQLPRRRPESFIELGEAHYRRSENSWSDSGRPTARVSLHDQGGVLAIRIEVPTSDLQFAPPGAINLYDNEPADINGDGVQLYVNGDSGVGAWMLVPDADSTSVRVRTIDGWSSPRSLRANWQRLGGGYAMDVELDGPLPAAVDVIVNEMPRGRVRRRGQLVMSGAQEEFVYLRGDRHDVDRLLSFRSTDE
jgi:hypothetical protein